MQNKCKEGKLEIQEKQSMLYTEQKGKFWDSMYIYHPFVFSEKTNSITGIGKGLGTLQFILSVFDQKF